MDKVKAIVYAVFVKHQFWTISLVLVAIGIAAWYMAAGKLKGDYTKNRSQIETAKTDVDQVRNKPVDQIFNPASHEGMEKMNAERRKEVFDSYRNFRAPNEIGARFPFRPPANGGALQGIGASQGTARGVARIAQSVEEAARVEKGAILVCPFTDPGWTVTLDRVAGVVTETGGLLSHAAVICREYGIPAVLAVPRATERIRDGQMIAIDGLHGSVELT